MQQPTRPDAFENVYFIGVGGIGMSALARYFSALGKQVAGYDRTPTELTAALQREGIAVDFEDDVARIPAGFLGQPDRTLVVYTPAVPTDHAQLTYLRAQGLAVCKRAEVLGLLTHDQPTVAVAGTHGKTTTSSMVAHLLRAAGRNVTAFLGGISRNYDSNLLLGQPSAADHVMVVEADEYDRSFLQLQPTVAVITSAEADHLDIYGEESALQTAFAQFADRTQPRGHVLRRAGLGLPHPRADLTVAEYGDDSDHRLENVHVAGARFVVDMVMPGLALRAVPLRMPGLHNAENALAAAVVARHLGVPSELIREGLTSYAGVRRRCEVRCERPGAVLIDDYAHHPTEIAACLRAVRTLYPHQPLTVVFQPHLFSRTRDFAAGFAQSLSLADEVWLVPIYPAREAPLPGVNSALLAEKITCPVHLFDGLAAVVARVGQAPPPLLVVLGAGSIDQLPDRLQAQQCYTEKMASRTLPAHKSN